MFNKKSLNVKLHTWCCLSIYETVAECRNSSSSTSPLLSVFISFSLSSPHTPTCSPLSWTVRDVYTTHWQHAGDPLHSHHCSNMWGGWLTAAFSSCWIHQCVCFSWLHVILLFPGVSGVTVVTQKPPVVTQRTGETATMDCNLGTVTTDAAFWYKQTPGGVPHHVLTFRHTWSSPYYSSGFSSPKFTTTYQSTDYRLTINNVEEADSAVYYCTTWDDSVKEWVSQWFSLWQKPPHLVLLLFECLTLDHRVMKHHSV